MHRIHGGHVKKLAIVAVGVLAAVVLSGCSTTNKTEVQKATVPKVLQLYGDVRLSGSQNVHGDLSDCAGVGKFADIHVGSPVTVSNLQGKPVAVGVVRYGLGTNYFHDILDECTFRVRIPNVPRSKGIWVTVGREPRAPFTLRYLLATQGYFKLDANPPNVPNPPVATTPTTKA